MSTPIIAKIRFNENTEYDCVAYNRSNSSVFTCKIVSSDPTTVRQVLNKISLIEVIEDGKVSFSTQTYTKLTRTDLLPSVVYNEETGVSFDLVQLSIEKGNDSIEQKVAELEEIVNPTVDIASMTLDEYKEYVIDKMSEKCKQIIFDGVDVEIDGSNRRFSYKTEDQLNLLTAFNTAIVTKMPTPYHVNGEQCVDFDYMDIIKIYISNQYNLIYNTTYCNALKVYIKSLDNKDSVTVITYGQPLSEELMNNISERVKTSQAASVALLAINGISMDENKDESENETIENEKEGDA